MKSALGLGIRRELIMLDNGGVLFFSRRFRVTKEPPRHSETISAKKRYTLTPLYPTISGY